MQLYINQITLRLFLYRTPFKDELDRTAADLAIAQRRAKRGEGGAEDEVHQLEEQLRSCRARVHEAEDRLEKALAQLVRL